MLSEYTESIDWGGSDQLVFVVDVDWCVYAGESWSVESLFMGEVSEVEEGLEFRVSYGYFKLLLEFDSGFTPPAAHTRVDARGIRGLLIEVDSYEFSECDTGVCGHAEHTDTGRPNTRREWYALLELLEFTLTHGGEYYYSK
jgi:hypothetical protein